MIGASVPFLALTAIAYFVRVTSGTPNTPPFPFPTGAISMEHEELAQEPSYPFKNSKTRSDLPSTFNAGEQWPGCSSISTIRNQGVCGVCWAVSTASVIADRLCITTGQDRPDFISGSQIAGCTDLWNTSRTPSARCEQGWYPNLAMRYVALYGVASGGEYQSGVGCVPYNVGPIEHIAQTCPAQCTTSDSSLDVQDHQIDSYWTGYLSKGYTQADIDKTVLRMKTDIYQFGPIVACLRTDNEFNYWQDPEAPYDSQIYFTGDINHAIRIVGWGQTSSGINYWIIANSWGTGLGINGYYYITMGKNTAGIEAYNYAPIVDISQVFACDVSTFCGAPISQAVTVDPSDPNSDTFLFQGNCLLPVTKSNQYLSVTGDAVPIIKVFQGAPEGPITSYKLDGSGLALINPTGVFGGAGTGCNKIPGTSKYACDRGSGNNIGPTVAFIDPSGALATYSYYKNWFWISTGSSFQALSSGKVFADGGMTQVNAFLDIDGTSFYVFGTGSSNQLLVGKMSYPTDGKTFTWATQPADQSNVLNC